MMEEQKVKKPSNRRTIALVVLLVVLSLAAAVGYRNRMVKTRNLILRASTTIMSTT